MSVRPQVSLVFAVDLPALEWDAGAARAADRSKRVALWYFTGEGEYGRLGAVLYARASETRLVDDHDVPVPVLDTATAGAGVDTAAWREALRAFCEAHALPWSEPAWRVVSNVC